MGDGMGGGRNGRFRGAPMFGPNPGKQSIFPQKDAKSGRPKNSRSYHHPSHLPLDSLLVALASSMLRSQTQCHAALFMRPLLEPTSRQSVTCL